MSNEPEDDTAELPAIALTWKVWPETGSAQVQVDLAGLSDPGLVRTSNEDHFLVVRFGRTLETLQTSLRPDQIPARSEEVGYGLLVADGVGGGPAGELASRMAISTLLNLALHTPDWVLSTGEPEAERVMERMKERFREVDVVLRGHSSGDPNLAGMGTTMILACSLGTRFIIGHVGDSRGYLLRDGELHQLTRDHTLVHSLVALGLLTPEEAAKHPSRHVLSSALGRGTSSLVVDFQQALLADNDQLLLCTDGLTQMVDDRAICLILRSAATAKEACHALVEMTLKNGGKDNVTVVLARYRFGDG